MQGEQSKRERALFSPDFGKQEQLKYLGMDFLYLRVTCDVLIFVVNFSWIPPTPVVQGQLGNLQEPGAKQDFAEGLLIYLVQH